MNVRIAPVPAAQRQHAATLFAALIPSVRADAVGDTSSPERRFLSEYFAAVGARFPEDVWLGAWDGADLIGAVHVCAHVQLAAEVVDHQSRGVETSLPPGWVVPFVRRVANVDELAVASEYRRQSIARRLLLAAHAHLQADPSRDLRSITAHAQSPASIELFRASGYTVAAARETVPPDHLEGLVMLWDDAVYGGFEGRWVYRRLHAKGAAFGLRMPSQPR